MPGGWGGVVWGRLHGESGGGCMHVMLCYAGSGQVGWDER